MFDVEEAILIKILRIVAAGLLLFTIAACDGSSPNPTPPSVGQSAGFTPITYGDLSSYPNLASQPTTARNELLPQAAKYTTVQGMTFTSPDSRAAIGAWYKQQLTAKGWLQVADTAPLIGFVKDDRTKLIEIFLSTSGSGRATKVVAFYATGKKP